MKIASVLRRNPFITRLFLSRAMTSNAPRPGFDEEMSALYLKIADSHYHEDGPWKLMLDEIKKEKTAQSVLDIASGHGEPAGQIAKLLPGVKVVSTDFSEDMIKLARERLGGIPNVKIQQADMQELPFESKSFDIVSCSYGFMFAEDKDKALEEVHRCLKPGGLLVTTTWEKLDFMKLVSDIMTQVLGERPPPPPLNPMSLHEPGLFDSMLTKAGFVDIQTKTGEYPIALSNDLDIAYKMTTLLVKDKLNEIEGGQAKARKAFDALSPKWFAADPNGVKIVQGNVFQLFVCRKPKE